MSDLSSKMVPFRQRLVLLIVPWFVTALAIALSGRLSLEAGESQVAERMGVFIFAPLLAALSLAFVFSAPRDPSTWLTSAFLMLFLVQAILVLASRRRAVVGFLVATILVILVAAFFCALQFFYHLDTTGRG
jgi:hypothetical protein